MTPISLPTNQKLVSFICGLGLVGGAVAGLSRLSGEAGTSEEDDSAPRRGETGIWDRVGLADIVEAGDVGEVGVALRCAADADNGDDVDDIDDGVPAEERPLGDTENVVAVLRQNLASNSLHTAKLRLVPSDPAATPNPAAVSVPLASSWQRSTKLPLWTGLVPSLSNFLMGHGLLVWTTGEPAPNPALGPGLGLKLWL